MTSYAERLAAVIAQRGQFCVGIDPHRQLVEQWGLGWDLDGVERFSRGLVEALGESVAVFKPQSAFFEVWGSAGGAVLERVLADIRQAGALSLLDVKRGDIGSTMAAYARAHLTPYSPMAADAITVSPYLGVGALAPAVELAVEHGRGLYVLVRTSNPEGTGIQTADLSGVTLAQSVLDEAARVNAECGVDVCGAVIGATHSRIDVSLAAFTGSVLMPGIGAQGATIADLPGLMGDHLKQVLPTSSRQIAQAGPDPVALRAVVADTVAQMDVLTGRIAS